MSDLNLSTATDIQEACWAHPVHGEPPVLQTH